MEMQFKTTNCVSSQPTKSYKGADLGAINLGHTLFMKQQMLNKKKAASILMKGFSPHRK